MCPPDIVFIFRPLFKQRHYYVPYIREHPHDRDIVKKEEYDRLAIIKENKVAYEKHVLPDTALIESVDAVDRSGKPVAHQEQQRERHARVNGDPTFISQGLPPLSFGMRRDPFEVLGIVKENVRAAVVVVYPAAVEKFVAGYLKAQHGRDIVITPASVAIGLI